MSTRVERSAAPLTETPLRAAMLRRIRSRPTAIGAAFALGAMIGLALLAPLLAPQNPYDLTSLSIMDNRLPPGSTAMSGMTYWLGTDAQGRDMLSAILYGIRISLVVGLLATACAAAIGMGVGLFAGYLGGLIETALMRLVDFFLGFPTLLVALVLLAMIGRGVDKVVLAIVLVQWALYARLMRGSVLVDRRKEYVEAAKNLGFSRARIMLLHILPNCMGPILVFATIHVATAIALEATLSFLGVGVPVTEPSLGLLIANGFEHLLSGEYWISFYPGVALLVLIFSINLLGDRLRESLDPRRRA
jgi:peptide/nickel transport system permease protein